MNPQTVWEIEDEETIRRDQEIRFIEFAAFATYGFPGTPILGFPLVEVAMGLLIMAAWFRKPRYPSLPTVTALAFFLLVVFALSAYINDMWNLRRLIHIGGFFALILVFANGRVHMRSAGAGLAAGLTAGIVISAIQLGGGAFSARMSGQFADPNGGSYIMLTLGCVALSVLQHKGVRALFILVVSTGVLLTLSRTGILALAFIVVWVINARILGWATKALLGAVMIYFVGNVPDAWKLWGPFSDRTGSDLLRQRIEAASAEQAATSGWLGHGPGTSRVNVEGLQFFFHSSYLALRNEVGWIGFVTLLAMLAWAAFSLIRLPRKYHNTWLECALLAAAVVAVTVGEILLDLPTAVAIGASLQHVSKSLLQMDQEDPERGIDRRLREQR